MFAYKNNNLILRYLAIVPLAFVDGVSVEQDTLSDALREVITQEEIPLVISRLYTAK